MMLGEDCSAILRAVTMISHVPGSPWMFGALFGASLYVSATAFAAEPVEMSRHLFGDSGSDNFGCALELANGDLLLAGTSRDAVTDDPDILVVRTDAQGATLWQQKFGQPGRVERTRQKECLAPTPDGHFVVECEHSRGHNLPPDATELVWTFLSAHVKGQPSPWVDNLPAELPDMCRLPEG